MANAKHYYNQKRFNQNLSLLSANNKSRPQSYSWANAKLSPSKVPNTACSVSPSHLTKPGKPKKKNLFKKRDWRNDRVV